MGDVPFAVNFLIGIVVNDIACIADAFAIVVAYQYYLTIRSSCSTIAVEGYGLLSVDVIDNIKERKVRPKSIANLLTPFESNGLPV